MKKFDKTAVIQAGINVDQYYGAVVAPINLYAIMPVEKKSSIE